HSGAGAVGVELPLLVAAAVAGPDDHLRARGGALAVGVQAVRRTVIGDGQLVRGCAGPGLVRLTVAAVDLHLRATGRAAVRVVKALTRALRVQSAGAAATAAASAVSGGVDVGLHRALGGVRRVAGRHRAFVEGPRGPVAVVTADAEEDRALLVHRVVAGWARSAVEGGQAARLGVAAADRPLVRFALDDRGGEPV